MTFIYIVPLCYHAAASPLLQLSLVTAVAAWPSALRCQDCGRSDDGGQRVPLAGGAGGHGEVITR